MRHCCYSLTVVGMLLAVGCKPASPPAPNSTDTAVSTPLPGGEATGAAAPAASLEAVDDEPFVLAGDELAADETPAEPATVDVTATESSEGTSSTPAPSQTDPDSTELVRVELGSDELTAGIPGDGPLTIEQIQTWLDNAENHRSFEPVLPMGLQTATANIQGIAQNPMTRAKIELGRQLYFDARLSSDGTISCASCHAPDEGFGRHTQFGVGVGGQEGNRNSPISYNRIVSGPQFWDGRAASLEEQAGGPIANPIEMGNTHDKAIETIKGIEGYQIQFAKIFPDQAIDMDAVTKAIATFERAIVSLAAPYDHHEFVRTIESSYADEIEDLKEEDPELFAQYEAALEGSKDLSESAKRGRDLFFSERGACTACHAGGNFTDEKYHNLGVGMDVDNPDLGRFAVTNNEADKGAFKTPTVRNVALSAPYMHDGSQDTLEEVVDWYVKGGHPNPFLSDKVKKLDLNDQEKQDLVAFMTEALSSRFPRIETERLPE